MTRRDLIAVLCLLLGSSVVAGQEVFQPGISDEQRSTLQRVVETFESPERQIWQKPEWVLEMLEVRPGDRVVDLGAGTGYFTRLLSDAVGTDGKVYAVDSSQTMIDYIAQRDDLMFGNVETVLADPDDPKLTEDQIDLVLLVNTWQYIEDRVAYLEKLAGLLERPSGRVAIIDWRKEELPMGPPVFSKIAREVVVAEFTEARWTLKLDSHELPYQYFLIFVAPGEPVVPAGDVSPDSHP